MSNDDPFRRLETLALVDDAVAAFQGQSPRFDAWIAELAADDGAEDAVTLGLLLGVDHLWSRGWGPADLVHVVTRLLTPEHASIAAATAVQEATSRAAGGQRVGVRWQGEVDDLVAAYDVGELAPLADLHRHIEVLAVVRRLPSVAPTLPRPGSVAAEEEQQMRHLDARMLARVRALLAKAESTTFEEEAHALTAKAQELIARHAVDEAMLHTVDDVGEPSTRRLYLDDPYLDAKGHLIAQVGDANRCRVVQEPAFGWITAFGYEGDLDAIELLGVSLLAQATAAMTRHGSVRDRRGRSRTRSFRRAFLFGFGQRIGDRLRQAAEEQVRAAAGSGTALVPVFVEQNARIEAATATAYPDVVRRPTSVSNAHGWAAGRVAADEARLDPARPLRQGRDD